MPLRAFLGQSLAGGALAGQVLPGSSIAMGALGAEPVLDAVSPNGRNCLCNSPCACGRS